MGEYWLHFVAITLEKKWNNIFSCNGRCGTKLKQKTITIKHRNQQKKHNWLFPEKKNTRAYMMAMAYIYVYISIRNGGVHIAERADVKKFINNRSAKTQHLTWKIMQKTRKK